MSTKWNLDPAHSEITFKVKHMMISNVKGSFKDFTAEMSSSDDNFNTVEAKADIDVNSIYTNSADRDNHLKSADFFDAETSPKIHFEANSLNGDVEGFMTIKGIKKPIKLEVDFGGVQVDPWGNTKAGFTFEGKISRKDFGLNWNAALEAGGVMVGDEVKINGDLQFTKA
jgi:polyisoprenoid-binding protein YceI